MHADAPTSNTAHAHGATTDRLAYSVKHAAGVLDVSERTVWNLLSTGVITSVKIGRSRRITRAALETYMAELQRVEA